jgi:nicotinamide mononucleotide transporter
VLWLEIVGSLLALLYVWLAARQDLWCWLAAIASSFVYFIIFYKSGLYAEAQLQIFFILSALVGLYWWMDKGQVGSRTLLVTSLPWRSHLVVIVVSILGGMVLGYVVSQYTNSKELSYIDSLIAVFSISNTFLTGRKVLESWLYWIVIDLFAIGLYLNRDLPITACLYALYVFLAIKGYYCWKDSIILETKMNNE